MNDGGRGCRKVLVMGVTRLIPVRIRPTCPPKDSLDYPIPANVLVELRMPEYIHTRENEPDRKSVV